MPTPSDPLRLKVIDRFVTVLTAITAGANYFYKPGQVVKQFLLDGEVANYPCYCVVAGDKGGPIDIAGAPDIYQEVFYVTVIGYVNEPKDTVTVSERALRDVRRAINEDTRPAAGSGSLHNLAVTCFPASGPDMDDGSLAAFGRGYFRQIFEVKIEHDLGE